MMQRRDDGCVRTWMWMCVHVLHCMHTWEAVYGVTMHHRASRPVRHKCMYTGRAHGLHASPTPMQTLDDPTLKA